MARPKKEEKLKHKNYITLKLTDIELACLEQSAEALNISRVEYLRNLIWKSQWFTNMKLLRIMNSLRNWRATAKKCCCENHYIIYEMSRSGSILFENLHLSLDIILEVKCYQSSTPIQWLFIAYVQWCWIRHYYHI